MTVAALRMKFVTITVTPSWHLIAKLGNYVCELPEAFKECTLLPEIFKRSPQPSKSDVQSAESQQISTGIK
jgi:hypothetical protein